MKGIIKKENNKWYIKYYTDFFDGCVLYPNYFENSVFLYPNRISNKTLLELEDNKEEVEFEIYDNYAMIINRISKYCKGEICYCGQSATQKIEQTIFDDMPIEHPLVQYVCQKCFDSVLRPYNEPKETWSDIASKFKNSIDNMTASANYHCQIIEWLEENYNTPSKK